MRIIFTGSRNWSGVAATRALVDVADTLLLLAIQVNEKLTIVHGDCPTGADQIIDDWARRRDDMVTLATFPAAWGLYGSGAGPRRNQDMIDAGADIVIAAPRGISAGTAHCMTLARVAGIPVYTVAWDPEWGPPNEAPVPTKRRPSR